MDPVTPYAGTSGWSGSSTSEDRARTADADGTTSERQRRVVVMLARAGATGLTVKEVRHDTGWHHGQASSMLSVLHKEGVIQRLSATRDRCKVYVLPEWLEGREIEPPGRTRGSQTVIDAERERILARLDHWLLLSDPTVLLPVGLAFRQFKRIVEDLGDHAG